MEGGYNRELKVWVNGTFDVVHRGHIELLNYANSLGVVRVGIDTDIRVKKLKGNERPINMFDDRSFVIKNLKSVDSVVGFSSDEELEIEIALWGPDYLIVGSDYRDKRVIGSHLAKNVLFYEKIDGYSSTKIIEHGKNFSDR